MSEEKGKNLSNIRLESSQPIDDGGRRYNFIYPIAIIVCFILFASIMGISGIALICGIFLGAISAWVTKNIICRFKCSDLRTMTFACDNKIPYAQLIQAIQPTLLPLGMNIEISSQGYMVITYKGVYYDVFYNNDQTFSIAWRMSVLGALLTRNEYISQYRKACIAYGIIGYYVQSLCQNGDQNNKSYYQDATFMNNIQNSNPTRSNETTAQARFCRHCGSEIIAGVNTPGLFEPPVRNLRATLPFRTEPSFR